MTRKEKIEFVISYNEPPKLIKKFEILENGDIKSESGILVRPRDSDTQEQSYFQAVLSYIGRGLRRYL